MASLIHRAERGFRKEIKGWLLVLLILYEVSYILYMAVKMVCPEKQNPQHRGELVSTARDRNFSSLGSESSKQGFEFTASLPGHETVSR